MNGLYQVGASVRMSRPPHYRGTIVAVQLPIFEMGGGRYYCRWRFKPEGWKPKTAMSEHDLEIMESETNTNN